VGTPGNGCVKQANAFSRGVSEPLEHIRLGDCAVNGDEGTYLRISQDTASPVQQLFNLRIVAHADADMVTCRGQLGHRSAARCPGIDQLIHRGLVNVVNERIEVIADQVLCRGLTDITQTDITHVSFAV
jgi:hypothetical protein